MTTTEQGTSTSTDDTSREFRNRVVLPLALPIGIVLGMVLVIGTIAFSLLYATKGVAVAVAGVLATGIMVAMALASSVDEEDMTTAKRAVIGATAVVPALLAIGIALVAANGGIYEQDQLAINATPPELAPEGAEVGAQNSDSFCEVPDGEDECGEDSQELELPAQPESEAFQFLFVNEEAGVNHNFQLFELADGGAGEPVFTQEDGAELIAGPGTAVYEVDQSERVFEPEQQFYFNCSVHPNMQGTLTISEPVG